MTENTANFDPSERDKFDRIAASWWDPEGESRPLHELNPARVRYVRERVRLKDSTVLDVGCGGGILSEALAREEARVTGIDIAGKALAIARLHLLESGLEVNYQESTAEQYAAKRPGQFDVVTCMELLEHVPDPSSVVAACSDLLSAGGHCFLSTLNRTPAAFALAILGAEHMLKLIPRGTHQYDRFIRPSELASWLRAAGLEPLDVCGLHYNPVTRSVKLGGSVSVNYLVHATKPGSGK
jgi:2-polyprenyl-6-hydroxyphenyl methylase/3-demethylubiquinone-9 3-methyltransferase